MFMSSIQSWRDSNVKDYPIIPLKYHHHQPVVVAAADITTTTTTTGTTGTSATDCPFSTKWHKSLLSVTLSFAAGSPARNHAN
jgi:hypothetical protein